MHAWFAKNLILTACSLKRRTAPRAIESRRRIRTLLFHF